VGEPTLATSVSVKSGGVTAEAGLAWRTNSERHPAKRPATTASRMRRSALREAVTLAKTDLTFILLLGHAVAVCTTGALSKCA
jgi:hypothetical protein